MTPVISQVIKVIQVAMGDKVCVFVSVYLPNGQNI